MLILKKQLSEENIEAVLFSSEKIEIDHTVLRRVEESFSFLKEFSKNKVIYGVNTGFGPMAQYQIAEKDQIALQYNLIRSHASGTGKVMSPLYVKALMLARLNTFCLGKSGIHPIVIEVLVELINKNIFPVIFEHGGVGASGDLVQLAHLALVMIGEGEVLYEGKRRPTKIIFKKEKINPINIKCREGLSLINGTSAMTGIGLVNVHYAKRLVDWAVFSSALLNEIAQSFDDHFSEELNTVKLHPGQREIARRMREQLSDSKRIRKREDQFFKPKKEAVFEEKVQEYYSLRCVPQILGPVFDTVCQTSNVLMAEINSANDNPIVDFERKNIYHGGNFHGDYVALEMDKIKIAITKLSMLSERQLNYLMNDKLNGILPPFVNMGKLGLNFGMQGIQFTATSTTAENQALSNSVYVHSIPNNNDNQDIVSMGTNAANMAKIVIENAFEVLAIEVMTIVQAVYCLDIEDELSSTSKQKIQELKKLIPPFKTDEILYPYIQKVKGYICHNTVS